MLMLLRAPEKRLFASEKAMHPSRVHSCRVFWMNLPSCEERLFLSLVHFSERRRARCNDPIALSYWPTSMHSAALLFNLLAKMLREFSGGEDEGGDWGIVAGVDDVVDEDMFAVVLQ